MTTDNNKIWVYEKHWAGRDDMKDYINVSNDSIAVTRHVPTGLEMTWSRHRSFQDGGSNYSAFDFGINLLKPEWEVMLLVYKSENGEEGAAWKIKKERGLEFISDASKILRETLGNTFTITEVTPVPPKSHIPWTVENIQILMNMLLIQWDHEAFRTGGAPKPDRVVFAPAHFPKDLYAELSNFVPEPKP